MSKHEPLEALARAYDREDASQRGEPDPWKDADDDAEWVSERLACAQVAEAAYLAARSVPEAGKAVDELAAVSAAIGSLRFMDPPDGGSVTLAEQVARMRHALEAAEAAARAAKPIIEALIAQEYNVETWGLKSRLAAIEAALASVAPSGAEPIGCIDRFHQKYADAKTHAINTLIEKGWTPVCASPQAVPAEDVASLVAATEAELAAGSLSAMDWNTRSIALVRKLLAALTSISAERDGLRRLLDGIRGRGVSAMLAEAFDAQQASEAEATSLRERLATLQRRFDLELDAYAKDSDMADLRRKLDGHRRALELARCRLEALDGFPFAIPKDHNKDVLEYIADYCGASE